MKTLFFAIKRFFKNVKMKWLNYVYAVLNILASGIIIYLALNIEPHDITMKIAVVLFYIFSALLFALGILYLTPFGKSTLKHIAQEDTDKRDIRKTRRKAKKIK